jgi:hypothetical protein
MIKGKKNFFDKDEETKIDLFYDRNIEYSIKFIYKWYYENENNIKNKKVYKSWLLKNNTMKDAIRIITIFNKIKNAINYINKYSLFSKLFFKKYEINISPLEIYNKFFIDLIIFNNDKKYKKYDISIFGGIILRIMNNNINNCDIDVICRGAIDCHNRSYPTFYKLSMNDVKKIFNFFKKRGWEINIKCNENEYSNLHECICLPSEFKYNKKKIKVDWIFRENFESCVTGMSNYDFKINNGTLSFRKGLFFLGGAYAEICLNQDSMMWFEDIYKSTHKPIKINCRKYKDEKYNYRIYKMINKGYNVEIKKKIIIFSNNRKKEAIEYYFKLIKKNIKKILVYDILNIIAQYCYMYHIKSKEKTKILKKEGYQLLNEQMIIIKENNL